MRGLHRPAGTLAAGGFDVELGPGAAGWTWTGLRVLRLDPGGRSTFATGQFEVCVLPLSGGSCTLDAGGVTMRLEGRASVFERVTDFAYVGRGTTLNLTSDAGCEVAVPMARCTRSLPPRYGPAEDVSVEVRGAGPATRQVTNFLTPEVWGHADKLMCCELLTPDGNWSSYPPHRHDDSPECPVHNEEIYYFRIGRIGGTSYDPTGFGLHRTYTTDGEIDENVVVRDGDVFLVPKGYHGPCIAAPGHPMYYLNVLAGPSAQRSMAFCDDPTHHWVREAWDAMEPDPRCPMTSAAGPV
jgi:5-deoxy-glucuronate isomerase